MLLEKVNDLYKELTSTIRQFKSLAFKDYFLKKAEEDFKSIKVKPNGEKRPCAMKAYLETQENLLDTLKRQTVIYNMYNDDTSRI